jgi:hypothetical protein
MLLDLQYLTPAKVTRVSWKGTINFMSRNDANNKQYV